MANGKWWSKRSGVVKEEEEYKQRSCQVVVVCQPVSQKESSSRKGKGRQTCGRSLLSARLLTHSLAFGLLAWPALAHHTHWPPMSWPWAIEYCLHSLYQTNSNWWWATTIMTRWPMSMTYNDNQQGKQITLIKKRQWTKGKGRGAIWGFCIWEFRWGQPSSQRGTRQSKEGETRRREFN